MEASTREALDDSIRFWERGRVLCNVVLAGVVLFWLGVAWPFLPPNWMVPLAGALFMLAVLANVFYCAAYDRRSAASAFFISRRLAALALGSMADRDVVRGAPRQYLDLQPAFSADGFLG